MNIAICDDLSAHLDLLDDAITNCSVWKGDTLSIDRFSNGPDLLRAVESGKTYSFVFLDIQMPDVSGLDIYSRLDQNDTAIVFVSTYMDLLPEALSLHPPGFLAKPYTQDTFDRTVKSVLALRADAQFFTYVSGGRKYAIPCRNIYYFSVNGHYLYIHCITGKDILYGITLKDVARKLSTYGFYRCNRTHLVNLRYCTDRLDDSIVLSMSNEKREIQLSRRKSQEYDSQILIYKWRDINVL